MGRVGGRREIVSDTGSVVDRLTGRAGSVLSEPESSVMSVGFSVIVGFSALSMTAEG